jgi:hypothetical protein
MSVQKYLVTTCALAMVLALFISPVMAGGKSPDVIAKSNGFPSGMHFNLNFHGKDLSLDDPCTHEAGGNSVFIDLYGMSTIEYQSDKKGSETELTVIDPCASDDGKVSVKIPRQVTVVDDVTGESVTVPVDGYYVYGRILGKPQNGNKEERSSIVFAPNMVTDVSNYDDDDETLLPVGLITWHATYYAGDEAFYRFEDPTAKGKGQSKAREMTHLFEFTGWVVDASLDTNNPLNDGVADGVIDIWDVPLGDYDEDTDTPDNRDFNNDKVDDDLDIEVWLLTQGDLATHYDAEWIFNIADIVTTEGEIDNDGTKLFQTRFYPYFE